MTSIIPNDASAVPTVQFTTPESIQAARLARFTEASEEKRRNAFFFGMQEAVVSRDLAALRVAAPMLTQAEAKSLLFHAAQLDMARAWGLDNRAVRYARETWGAQVPRVVMSATLKVRVAGLMLWHPELSAEEARCLVEDCIRAELDGSSVDGTVFWRYAPTTPCFSDLRAASRLQQKRAQALLEAQMSYFDAPLRAAHTAALEVLEGSGLPFELLVEWHKTGRATQRVKAAGEAA